MPVPRPSYPMIAARQLEAIARESGIPDELVPGVSKLLRKILDKQAIDERLNYQWLDQNSGTGVTGPTYVVAASDATDREKERADVVCDGVGDDSTVTDAVWRSGVSNDRGGWVQLTSGTFYFTAGGVSMPFGTRIEGVSGRTLIELDEANGYAFDMYTTSVLANMDIYCNSVDALTAKAVRVSGASANLKNLYIYATGGISISPSAFALVDAAIRITDCGISSCWLPVYIDRGTLIMTNTQIIGEANAGPALHAINQDVNPSIILHLLGNTFAISGSHMVLIQGCGGGGSIVGNRFGSENIAGTDAIRIETHPSVLTRFSKRFTIGTNTFDPTQNIWNNAVYLDANTTYCNVVGNIVEGLPITNLGGATNVVANNS